MIQFAQNQIRKNKLLKELKRITRIIIKDYSPEKIILFGSLASDQIHSLSDIDIAIVKSTKKRFIERLYEVSLLVKPKLGVHFLVYTPQELESMVQENRLFLTKEILGKGHVLYARKPLV